MALEKIVAVDKIEVVENGVVQVRTATKFIEDGKELNRAFHRHVVVPGADYSNEDSKVQAICSAVQTPEVVATYQAAIAAKGI
ncbi:MAG: hypothetical protein EBS36_06945 [Actinobacteria bacterium]|nr:hypothetical protein [Actinomycetota bacterium]